MRFPVGLFGYGCYGSASLMIELYTEEKAM